MSIKDLLTSHVLENVLAKAENRGGQSARSKQHRPWKQSPVARGVSGGGSVPDTRAQCNCTGSHASLQPWICCNTSGGDNVRHGVYYTRMPTKGLLVVEVCLY